MLSATNVVSAAFARAFLLIKAVSAGSNTEAATVSPKLGEDAKRQLVRAKPAATMHAAMNNIDFILFLKFKITDKNEGESKL